MKADQQERMDYVICRLTPTIGQYRIHSLHHCEELRETSAVDHRIKMIQQDSNWQSLTIRHLHDKCRNVDGRRRVSIHKASPDLWLRCTVRTVAVDDVHWVKTGQQRLRDVISLHAIRCLPTNRSVANEGASASVAKPLH